MRSRQTIKAIILSTALFIAFAAHVVVSQTTAFTYQGKLTDSSQPANGTYEMEFRLFNDPQVGGGGQQGATISLPSVQALGGVFTTSLDFGSEVFETGNSLYLEISLRPAGSQAAFTTLTPRQAVTSAPYAVRAKTAGIADNSANLGSIPASSYVLTGDNRLSDARTPLPGSNDYVQNTTNAQATSNFNISGTGKANIFEAGIQYNIAGNRVLFTDANTANVFVGIKSGLANPTGAFNSFFGYNSGISNTSGEKNTFLGLNAGFGNSTGSNNTFIGLNAGSGTTSGNLNTIVGSSAGFTNTTGGGNTLIGGFADFGSNNLSFATAIGAGAIVNTSNTVALGRALDTVFVPGNLTVNGPLNAVGTFSSNIVNATTQFNLNSARVLANPGTNNLFLGIGAGQSNTSGNNNAYFGTNAGQFGTTASKNAFFGAEAGINSTGNANVFIGAAAGKANTSGFANAFVGSEAGLANLSSQGGAFFGYQSGYTNTTGNLNSFFGAQSGYSNLSGSNNAFFGTYAGRSNSTADWNAFFGVDTGRNTVDGAFNAFFGGLAGRENIGGANNSFFGTAAGRFNSSGSNNSFIGLDAGLNNTTGNWNTFVGTSSGLEQSTGSQNTLVGALSNVGATNLTYATAIGAGAVVSTSDTIVLGRSTGEDQVRIPGLGVGGSLNLCRNADNEISTCSSSIRYKTNIADFTSGLDVIRQLRPITFDWKAGGMHDLGLGAEDVAEVNELLVIRNAAGQVEGVKYDRIGVVLINAVKEQQAKIDELEKQIAELKALMSGRVAKEEKK